MKRKNRLEGLSKVTRISAFPCWRNFYFRSPNGSPKSIFHLNPHELEQMRLLMLDRAKRPDWEFVDGSKADLEPERFPRFVLHIEMQQIGADN